MVDSSASGLPTATASAGRSRRRFGPRSKLVAALGLTLAAAPTHRAGATFDEQLVVNTRALSLANSVTADPPGPLSIHYNPAGLSLTRGRVLTQGITVALIEKTSAFEDDPDFEGYMGGFDDDPVAGTKGTSTSGRMYLPFYGPINFAVGPSLGFAHRAEGSKWAWGFGNYVPFAVGLNHGESDDPSRFGAKALYQQHLIYAAPGAAYQLTDHLSVGLSVGAGQTALGAEVDLRSPNDMVALTRVLGDATKDLEIPILSELTFPPPWFGGGVNPYDPLASMSMDLRDDFSPSFNVGVLYRPFDWISLGGVYQSAIRAQLHGKYRFDYSEEFQRMVDWFGSSPLLLELSGMFDLPTESVPSQSGTVTVRDYTLPQRIQLGVQLKPWPWLRLNTDLHWANWSVVDTESFEFDQRIQLLQLVKMLGYTGGDDTLVLERHFEDTLHWSFGLELDPVRWITLRFGYEDRKSAVQSGYFDLIYALPDTKLFTTGLGIHLPHGIDLDLAFGYLVNRSFRIPDNGSSNLNSTRFTTPIYNPYAGLDYEQKTVAYLISTAITKAF